MDPSGCPPGFATDNWIVMHAPGSCEVPIAAFVVIFGCLILIKLFVVRRIWVFWLARREEMRKSRKLLNRHPVVPVLLSIISILYILNLILVSTNVISAVNGWGTVLYTATCFVWATYSLFHVKKYISLGRRLIPLAMAQVPEALTPTSSTSGSESQGHVVRSSAEQTLSILNKFDIVLQLLVALMFGSIAGALIVSLIPGLIHPQQPVWARISSALIGFFALFLEISLLYHLERLIRATKSIFNESAGRGSGGNAIKLKHAIKIMRTSQTVWFGLGNVAFTVFLLSGLGVIDLGWIFLLCTLAIETTASSFAYFATKSRANTQESSSSKGRNSKGNLEVKGNLTTIHSQATLAKSPQTSFKVASLNTFVGSEVQ